MPVVEPVAVRAAVERADRDRALADDERSRATAENVEAQLLLRQADRDDARAEQGRAAAEYEPEPDERERAAAEAEQSEATAGSAREDERTLSVSAESREVTFVRKDGQARAAWTDTERRIAALQAEERRGAGDTAPQSAATDRGSGDGRAPYDSAERRTATAGELEAKGIDRDVVATRMRADVSQAKPASEAVKPGASRKSPKARKTHGRTPQAQRAELDR